MEDVRCMTCWLIRMVMQNNFPRMRDVQFCEHLAHDWRSDNHYHGWGT